MSRLSIAIEQIATARRYTERLLDGVSQADWFRMPQEGVTHIAWQVGHLAMAEYRLTLDRLRGERPEDEQLISREFLALFGKGSAPDPDNGKYPAPDDIRAVFARVHEQVLAELPGYTDDQLQAPPLKPHSLFNRRIDSLYWCVRHEMVHAGQIGLLRRLLGHAPQW